MKTEGPLRDWAYARIPWLVGIVFVIIAAAVAVVLGFEDRALPQGHLADRAWGWVFAVLAVLALLSTAAAARARRDGWPFALTTLFFVAAFLTLSTMFWPYMVPYALTVGNAAAPDASLRFLFYGGVVVLPVIAIYTIGVYWVFRGKAKSGYR